MALIQEKTINQFFSDDHHRLDSLYARFETAWANGETQRAAALFAEFSRGLLQHIHWEEDQLFPLFEQHSGMVDAGPTFVMCREHLTIQRLLALIEQLLSQSDPSVVEHCREMTNILAQHNRKEEGVLYPAIDELCSDVEIKTVLANVMN